MQITLYSKPDCPLCDELKADLQQMQPEFGFALVERNILEDAADLARFQTLIPVLDIAGSRLLYPPHSVPEIYRVLAAARRDSTA